uniref:Putative holin n=1 Tax=viral metagenome TaxID=1070528 RepID=A0A6M3JYR1_9ZZZZ
MNLSEILSSAGDLIGNFVPGANIVLKGAGALAGMIGGETGKKIEAGAQMLAEGMHEAGKTPLSPEQQIQQEKIVSDTKIEMAKIKFADKKLDYDDQAGGRDVIKTALISDDPIVRQARPRMMVKLGNAAIMYTVGTPIIVIIAAALKVPADILGTVTQMIIWQGATLWGAFMTSFTGYTIARSADKKTQANLDCGLPVSKMTDVLSKIGHKIS